MDNEPEKYVTQGKDTFLLVSKHPITYFKQNIHFSEKKFAYYPCGQCGKLISNCGWAFMSHYNMHKRNGEAR